MTDVAIQPTDQAMERRPRRLHPLPLRIMHWINAIAMILMIGAAGKSTTTRSSSAGCIFRTG